MLFWVVVLNWAVMLRTVGLIFSSEFVMKWWNPEIFWLYYNFVWISDVLHTCVTSNRNFLDKLTIQLLENLRIRKKIVTTHPIKALLVTAWNFQLRIQMLKMMKCEYENRILYGEPIFIIVVFRNQSCRFLSVNRFFVLLLLQ